MGLLYTLLLQTNSAKPIVYYQTIHPSKKSVFVPLARLRLADSNESA
jgi:hypothetical protein